MSAKEQVGYLQQANFLLNIIQKDCLCKKNNTRDSNVVPHRSTNRARWCLTSQSGRDAVLSSWYGRSFQFNAIINIKTCT